MSQCEGPTKQICDSVLLVALPPLYTHGSRVVLLTKLYTTDRPGVWRGAGQIYGGLGGGGALPL